MSGEIIGALFVAFVGMAIRAGYLNRDSTINACVGFLIFFSIVIFQGTSYQAKQHPEMCNKGKDLPWCGKGFLWDTGYIIKTMFPYFAIACPPFAAYLSVVDPPKDGKSLPAQK